MRWLQVTALVFPTIKRKLDNWTTEMEKSYYLKVSNNQKRKHFQPDYDANDAFVDVASCWYCFSSAFFHCLSATRRVGRPSQYSWLRVPGSHQSAQHQGHILRLGKGQQQQRVEIREDAGDGGPSPSSRTMALRNLMRSLGSLYMAESTASRSWVGCCLLTLMTSW